MQWRHLKVKESYSLQNGELSAICSQDKGKVQKKRKKNLTSVSFAFTHAYTPVKTNTFPFFPQAYMENFEKCAKTQKQKINILSHVKCGC